jgi:hypothetical protein
MRHLAPAVTLAVMLLVPVDGAHAQTVPQTVTFTARLEAGGVPLEGTIDLDLELFDAPVGGTSLWAESRTLLVTGGLVDLELGTLSALAGVFDGASAYLAVTIDGTPLTPRAEITSVPYALRAGEAAVATALAGGFAAADFVTGVGAGPGLTGGGSSGDVQLGLAAAGTACSADTYVTGLDASGALTCAPELGDIQGVTTAAGSGLQGGAASGTPSLALAPCGLNQVLVAGGGGIYACKGHAMLHPVPAAGTVVVGSAEVQVATFNGNPPGNGTMLLIFESDWNQPTSNGASRINCLVYGFGANPALIRLDPGDADGVIDTHTVNTLSFTVAPGFLDGSVKCFSSAAGTSATSVGARVTLLFAPFF